MSHLYAARHYAEALAGSGDVLDVPEWRAFALRRPIGGRAADAAGVYPLAILPKDAELEAGLARLQARGIISTVLVLDPLLAPPIAALRQAFDICRPFKTHYLIDRAQAPFAPTKHHRQEIRRGLRRCTVDQADLADHLTAWRGLYAELVVRRSIRGVADFSPSYFDVLAADPSLVAFVARVHGEVAGMALWFAAGGVVYNHLTAVGAAGYAAGASYALYDAAINHFGDGVINLGGGAGSGDGQGGLADFKRGFANTEIQSWLCGAVLDAEAYAELSVGIPSTDFFPAYRAPRT